MVYNIEMVRSFINQNGNLFTYVGFWGNRGATLEEKTFSNFHKSDFQVEIHDGRVITFCCNEQYFMYRKALAFEDYPTLEKILKSGLAAKDYKKLGRMVKNYNDKVWGQIRYDAMLDGLRLKYSQNEELKNILLNTGESILVETSPQDDIWGIKMSKSDDWKNPLKWKGQNLLGFALMELRDELNGIVS